VRELPHGRLVAICVTAPAEHCNISFGEREQRTVAREIRQAKPCVVVSPDEVNHHLRTAIVVPMGTGARRAVYGERLVKGPRQLEGETVLVVLEGFRAYLPNRRVTAAL
jgi:hypothetical protein